MIAEIVSGVKNHFKNSCKISVFERDDHYVCSFGWVALFAHPIFWLIWTYVDPQVENIYLRAVGFLSALVLLIMIYNERIFKNITPYYWIFVVFYNLPFFFTVNLLINGVSDLWLMAEIVMIFVTITFVPNVVYSFVFIVGGFLAACVFAKFAFGLDELYSLQEFFGHLPLYFLATVSAYVFNHNIIVNKEALRAEAFKVLAGSIVHELRNPLDSINLAVRFIKDNEFDRDSIFVSVEAIDDSLVGANDIIDIILSDLSEKEIGASDFSKIFVYDFVKSALERFAYRSKEERNRVFLAPNDDAQDFAVKAISKRFYFIICNLLKNSLYYIDEYPQAKIEVGIEKRDNQICVYVYDNGPGISEEVMPKLFEDFFTSGKKGGTGLGLSFCKRNMNIFGGDIICESEFGEWTKFSLLFPEISEEDFVKLSADCGKRRVLIVGDVDKVEIEYVVCDICDNLQDVVRMVKGDDYDVVLLSDVVENESVKALKRANAGILIGYFDQYLHKGSLRSVSKWLVGFEDDMTYLGKKEDYVKVLKGRNVVLADDQDVNRRLLKRQLESLGVNVVEAVDGEELVEICAQGRDFHFDMILTDINMPKMSGDEAVREISRYGREVPVIALTGDVDEEGVYRYLNCGITDYYIKGSDLEMLVKIMANYLIFR